MKRFFSIVFLATGFFNMTTAQIASGDLTKELSEIHENSGISGFAVSIFNVDSILYKRSFGHKNVTTKEPYATDERFYIASISKTFIGLALMKLEEEGHLKLSEKINDILPFQVSNPSYPNEEITVNHLARHTSTILYENLESKSWYLDNDFELKKKAIGKSAFKNFCEWDKNRKTALGVFLKSCLSPKGVLYSKKRYSKNKPGESYEYSNLGAALAAYIIEIKTGIPYDEYIENLVVQVFGFKPGIWRHRSIDNLPVTYFQTKIETPVHIPILYPAGGMMLSTDELTDYVIEMIKGFNGKSKVLQAASFQRMMTPENKFNGTKSGIFWSLNENTIGHNGGNYGVTCLMSFDKNTGIGKIFMTNISSYKNDDLLKEMITVWNKLKEYEVH